MSELSIVSIYSETQVLFLDLKNLRTYVCKKK